MKSVEVPVYSFVEHQRTKETQYLYGASVVILEGLFILSDPELRKLIDMKVFGMLSRHSILYEIYLMTDAFLTT
jgi:uridine kinase